MTKPDLLEGLHPALITAAHKIEGALMAMGHPVVATAGLRTTETQQAIYAQGRTTPGKVVTNTDGVHLKSNHQAQADGFGHAVDYAFLDAAGRPSWDLVHPWGVLGALGKYYGLKWGGDWHSLKDYPHLEL